MRFRLGELFCGAGGLALGAMRASVGGGAYRVRHAWASDFNEDACRTYRRNIEGADDASVLCADVRHLDLSTLSPIDGFAYGFPCNDFSIVGEHKGVTGEYGPLYSYGVRVLDRFAPRFFVAENVGGILSANDGNAFRQILSELRSAGPAYTITAHYYRFEEYGVPQTRHRMILVGIAKSEGLSFQVPAPTTLTNPRSARDAIEVPPIPDDAPNNDRAGQSRAVIERLMHIRPGENAWTADLPDHLRLNVKNARLSQIYKRLDPNLPSYTITGSGGGGTHGYHWSEHRALTNRERARIQTFPDDFVFEGKRESVRKQIGMAVPPAMAELLFTCILKTFAGIPYACVRPNWTEQGELFNDAAVASIAL